MRKAAYNAMPQFGPSRWHRWADFKWCEEMWNSRRKSLPYKQLGSSTYLYKMYSGHYEVWYGTQMDSWGKKCVTILPDDTQIIHADYDVRPSALTVMGSVTGLGFHTKRSKTTNMFLKARYWDENKPVVYDYDKWTTIDACDGFKFKAGKPMDNVIVGAKVRVIDKAKSKPFREKLVEWGKILETMHMLFQSEIDNQHMATGDGWRAYWAIKRGEFNWPKYEDVPSADVALNMLRWSHHRTLKNEWVARYDEKGSFLGGDNVVKETYFKNLMSKIITRLREEWYSANDVFTWKEAV